MEETKQVIVLRTTYPDDKGGTKKLRTGKLIAQATHASLKVFLDQGDIKKYELDIELTEAMKDWLENSHAKIVVYVNSEQELIEIYNKAKKADIICSMIIDAGRTEFHGVPTKTAVAIGPDYVSKIDKITGHLPLL